jgi:SET domain-containing protein
MLALFTSRSIDIGEELCFDYGGGEQEERTSTGVNKIPCYCESPNCRRFLPCNEALF